MRRSHECVSDGYQVMHDGRVVTVFSASRYCGTQSNSGAVVGFGPALPMPPQYIQFDASPLSSADARRRHSLLKVSEQQERRAAGQRLEQQAVQMLGEMICDRRPQLLLEFGRREVLQARQRGAARAQALRAYRASARTLTGESDAAEAEEVARQASEAPPLGPRRLLPGTLTLWNWAEAVQAVLGVRLPLLWLAPKLARVEALHGAGGAPGGGARLSEAALRAGWTAQAGDDEGGVMGEEGSLDEMKEGGGGGGGGGGSSGAGAGSGAGSAAVVDEEAAALEASLAKLDSTAALRRAACAAGLAEASASTPTINYSLFLGRYRIELPFDVAWEEVMIQQVMAKLRKVFGLGDTPPRFSSSLDVDEEREGGDSAGAKALPALLASAIAASDDEPEHKSAAAPPPPPGAFTRARASSGSSVAFSAFDLEQNGRISYAEFLAVMRTLGLGLSDMQVRYSLLTSAFSSSTDSLTDALTDSLTH